MSNESPFEELKGTNKRGANSMYSIVDSDRFAAIYSVTDPFLFCKQFDIIFVIQYSNPVSAHFTDSLGIHNRYACRPASSLFWLDYFSPILNLEVVLVKGGNISGKSVNKVPQDSKQMIGRSMVGFPIKRIYKTNTLFSDKRFRHP